MEMEGSKKEISCLLMVFTASVAMGSTKITRESRNKVPVVSRVASEEVASEEEDTTETSKCSVIDFFSVHRKKPRHRKDSFEDVCSQVRKKRRDFKLGLEELVAESPGLEPPNQSALLITSIVLGKKGLMEEMVIGKVALNNDEVFGFIPAHCAISLNSLDDLIFCIDCGTDVNARDDRGRTLLMMAIQKNDVRMVEFLLNCEGVDLSARDKSRKSVLNYADMRGNPMITALVKSAVNGNQEFSSPEYDTEGSSSRDSESDYEEKQSKRVKEKRVKEKADA